MLFFLVYQNQVLLAKDLIFKMKSVISSVIPGIDVNSCNIPLICTDVTAAPCSEESNIRLKALPKVKPKPLSKGSITTLPCVDISPSTTSIF